MKSISTRKKSWLYHDAVALLKELIRTPSFSTEEENTAAILRDFLLAHDVSIYRKKNNIWAYNRHFNPAKPTILLNSHHDTVQPNPNYTRNPYRAQIEDEKLFGLGSNDAGGCLVSLIATFLHFYDAIHLPFNLCLAATAEEENSGENGLKCILADIGEMAFAIVGEPTQMELAVAERGLCVLECEVTGKAGHAARNEGINAIELAMQDLHWLSSFTFPKCMPEMGKEKMTVTMIHAGTQHNILPGSCHYTVDVRLTPAYQPEEILQIVQNHVNAKVQMRPGCLKASSISLNHPVVKAGLAIGRKTYLSPTTSDQALLDFPSVKMGPGNSARSHMADEFVYLDDIRSGISMYIELLNTIEPVLLNNFNDAALSVAHA